MDYCFLRRAENNDKVTVLLQKDRDSRAIRSQVVEPKGVACEEAVAAAPRGINEFGHRGKIIIKAGRMRSRLLRTRCSVGWIREALRLSRSRTSMSRVGRVKIFKGLFQVHVIALERKIDARVPIDHPVVAWLVEFVGDVLTKYMVGVDGKTAYERLFGKKSREEHLEFGEVVLWRKPRGQDYNVVAEARWESGVWMGRRWGTPNHLVSFGNRVVERRAIQRVPKPDRWKREMVDAVRATRWANPAVASDTVVPAVLPGPAEPPPAPLDRDYARSAWRTSEDSAGLRGAEDVR